jgi:tRNA nucleotidyltransferase (CCA-adding enzyme)
MADYIYMLETRLLPEQLRGVTLLQETARAHQMNLYLTGGAVRDMISGFQIRDIDFTVEGIPHKIQKDLEKAGALVEGLDEEQGVIYIQLPGNVRASINMARSETYPKPGQPVIKPGAILEDLRRRDFTVNAMGLSLNAGSRGLLLDPANGLADIEAKQIRILHNYAFLEEPSRLIRATRFAARFHWTIEERTQLRYNAAVENSYIDHISRSAIGYEIEQLAYEEEPLHVMRALEKENWLKVLNPHWSVAKVDTSGLSSLIKTRQQMNSLGYNPDMSAGVMYFLTHRMSGSDQAAMQRIMPRKEFINTWKHLEDGAKDLAHRLGGKEAATPSRAWKLLSSSKPETILFLDTTTRNQSVANKIKNFFGKWRQLKQRIPLPEMTEMRITPDLPVYPKLVEDVFMLLLDGKLRSRTETVKFLKPFEPPPPPPPPPPPVKRGKKVEPKPQAAALPKTEEAGKGKKKGKEPPPAIAAKPAVAPAKGKPAVKPAPVKQVKAAPHKPAAKNHAKKKK